MKIPGHIIAAGLMSIGATTGAFAQDTPSAAHLHTRYQITQMERVLTGAAEHAARMVREKLRAIVPADMLLNENVRVRGIPLEGYGLFFDVAMPPLEGTLSIFQTLDQNHLGLESAIRELTTFVESSGNANLRQAWERVELHVLPVPSAGGPSLAAPVDARSRAAGSAAALAVDTSAPAAQRPRDAIVSNPQEAYRTEVREALIDAMLDHSVALRLREADWLTVAARGNEDRPRLSPNDYESPIIQISVRGSDLSTYQAKQITREEARKRFLIKVF
jgi:hypothetical protein